MIPLAPPTTVETLADAWHQGLAGDPAIRAEWRADGGHWSWRDDGVDLGSDGAEWSVLHWDRCGPAMLAGLDDFVIEVAVTGNAEAAGLSFGAYKDFLVPVGSGVTRRLQLEVDARAGCWAFRVDGRLMQRHWWDGAVGTVSDLQSGTLAFKARRVEHVRFGELILHRFAANCRLSVIVTCHRFVQRLRVTLRNWCHQTLPSGAYEVLVINPNSPDGTHEHMGAVARSYPHVRVREILVDAALATNKGAMINRALEASRGEWVWLADADCLFAPGSAAAVLDYVDQRHQRVFFGQRRYLTAEQTAALLSGRVDGLSDFDDVVAGMSPRPPDNAPWGYTQIVRRELIKEIRYRETFNHFGRTDELFIDDCRRRRVWPEQIPGLFCLHLDHPFSWNGTDAFL